MRIIGGTAKGRKLFTPPQHETAIRPTSDKAREALYSIIGKNVSGANVLDLFAGTGALGLEAFSRGARFVVFVDHHRLALKLLKKNILHCLTGYKGDCGIRVISHDLKRSLPLSKFPAETEKGFDLILADPPYAMKLSLRVLENINNSSLLAENGLLIIEERQDVELPSALTRLEQIDQRVYGDTAFVFYRTRKKI